MAVPMANDPPFAMLNHSESDSGIPNESADVRFGIRCAMQALPRTPSRLFSLALGLTALITPLAVHIFLPVIPAVKAELALSDAQAQFTFSIALFTMAFATLVYGSLSDRFGRRPVLLSGLALFLLGTVISVVAQSVATLAAGRLVQAIGAGCAM